MKNTIQNIVRFLIISSVILFSVHMAITNGIHEKSWWDKFWDLATGYGIGGGVGLGVGLLIGGGVGIVLMGTGVGIPFLAVLGIGGVFGFLGGGGISGIVHVIQNPKDYYIDWFTITKDMLLGLVAALLISHFVVRFIFVYIDKAITKRKTLLGQSGQA